MDNLFESIGFQLKNLGYREISSNKHSSTYRTKYGDWPKGEVTIDVTLVYSDGQLKYHLFINNKRKQIVARYDDYEFFDLDKSLIVTLPEGHTDEDEIIEYITGDKVVYELVDLIRILGDVDCYNGYSLKRLDSIPEDS